MLKKILIVILLFIAGCETPRMSIKTVSAKFEVHNVEENKTLYRVYSEDDYGTFVSKDYYDKIKIGQKIAAIWRHCER